MSTLTARGLHRENNLPPLPHTSLLTKIPTIPQNPLKPLLQSWRFSPFHAMLQAMERLVHLLDTWDNPEFDVLLKQQLVNLGLEGLPLQKGLRNSSYALDTDLQIILLSKTRHDTKIVVTAALFYTGVIAGCSCADDPTPEDVINEHCEIRVTISRRADDRCIQLLA